MGRNPEDHARDAKIAKLAATGLSLSKIAEETKKNNNPIKKSRVYTILQKPDIKALMEKEQQRLAGLIPKAVKNYETWVNNAHLYSDRADKDIAFKATTKVLESHGLVSGAPSNSVQIMINSGNTIISPVIQELLNGFMGKINGQEFLKSSENLLKSSEVVEAEFEDVEEFNV